KTERIETAERDFRIRQHNREPKRDNCGATDYRLVLMFGWKRRKVQRLDFIVPGAQKSGTTALHYFLRKHPQIALPDRQETHFFDDEEIFSQQPIDYELLHRHFRVRAGLASINRRLLV